MSSTTSLADFEYRLHLVEQQLGLNNNNDSFSSALLLTNNNNDNNKARKEDEKQHDNSVTNLEHKLNTLLLNNTSSSSSSKTQQTSQSTSTTTTTSLQLRQTLSEIKELLNELDPGTALTHQQQIVAPILYRRLELLSNKDDFQNDLNEASKILNLLMIGQESSSSSASTATTTTTTTTAGDTKTKASSKKKISVIEEQHVTQAPILIGTASEGLLDDDKKQRIAKIENELMEMTQRSTTVMSKLENVIEQYHSTMQAISEKTIQLDDMIRIREREQQKLNQERVMAT